LASYLIPGYQYPTVGLWGASLGSPVGGVGYIIANPNSGPGTTVNPDYTTAIANAQAAGWTVLGYVDTNYAAVALATVEGNVDKWFSLYGIVNIFFDRASELSTKVSYATSLTSYVHTTHGAGRSIMNMGAAPYSGFLTPSVVDGIVVFDATYAAFARRLLAITAATAFRSPTSSRPPRWAVPQVKCLRALHSERTCSTSPTRQTATSMCSRRTLPVRTSYLPTRHRCRYVLGIGHLLCCWHHRSHRC